MEAAGSTVSAESIQPWRDGAREVGVELQETEVQKILRKLKRKAADSEDEDKTIPTNGKKKSIHNKK